MLQLVDAHVASARRQLMVALLLGMFLLDLVQLLRVSYPLLIEQLLEALACFPWVLNLEVLEHAGEGCDGNIGIGSAVGVS